MSGMRRGARARVCVCVCGGDRPFIGVFHKVSQKLFYIIFFLAKWWSKLQFG